MGEKYYLPPNNDDRWGICGDDIVISKQRYQIFVLYTNSWVFNEKKMNSLKYSINF